MGLLPETALDMVDQISRRISAEFHRIVEPEDLVQEFYLFLNEKPGYLHNWFFIGEEQGDLLFGWKSFKRDVAGLFARVCRKERQKSGHETADEVFYSRKQVEALLPFVYHTTILATIGEAREADEIRAKTDAAKGGNHIAAVMDVRAAYDKAIFRGSDWDKTLRILFQFGFNQSEAAEDLRLSRKTINVRKQRAVDAILQELNGTMPLIEHEGPGSRSAMSNSASIAETRNH